MSKTRQGARRALSCVLTFLMATSTFSPASLAYAIEEAGDDDDAVAIQEDVIEVDDALDLDAAIEEAEPEGPAGGVSMRSPPSRSRP